MHFSYIVRPYEFDLLPFLACSGWVSQLLLFLQFPKAQTPPRVTLWSLPASLSREHSLRWLWGHCSPLVPVCPQELAEQEAAGWLPEQNSCRILRPRVADPGENPQWPDRGREIPAPGNQSTEAQGLLFHLTSKALSLMGILCHNVLLWVTC